MEWSFDPDIDGIDRDSKTIGGKHEDWPDIGEIPQEIYEQTDCGEYVLDDLDVGDKIRCYWGTPPVSLGNHPSPGYVYAMPPYKEDNYGQPRTIRDGRFAFWKGTGAYGNPITIPVRPDFVVEIVEKEAGFDIDHFNPEDDHRTF